VTVSVDARARSKRLGETVEALVVDRVAGLEAVPDETAVWHDARTTRVIGPRDPVGLGTCLVEPGVNVEIKAARRRLSTGRRGRVHIRAQQHERLLASSAVYAVAVYEGPDDDPTLLAITIVPASVVDELCPDEWTTVDVAGREGEAYAQLAWSNVVDPADVDGEVVDG
jgi:hypothetical protein